MPGATGVAWWTIIDADMMNVTGMLTGAPGPLPSASTINVPVLPAPCESDELMAFPGAPEICGPALKASAAKLNVAAEAELNANIEPAKATSVKFFKGHLSETAASREERSLFREDIPQDSRNATIPSS